MEMMLLYGTTAVVCGVVTIWAVAVVVLILISNT